MSRTRWDVRPSIETITHPATGASVTHYGAARVYAPEGNILPSELDRARKRATRAVGPAGPGRRAIVTPVRAAAGGGYAYVLAYVVPDGALTYVCEGHEVNRPDVVTAADLLAPRNGWSTGYVADDDVWRVRTPYTSAWRTYVPAGWSIEAPGGGRQYVRGSLATARGAMHPRQSITRATLAPSGAHVLIGGPVR